MKSYSIARRLIVTVLLVELVSALCVSGVAFVYERHTHFHSFDIMLHGRADSLLGAVQDSEDSQDNVMLDGSERSLPSEDIYQVIDSTGRMIGHSNSWAELPDRSHLDEGRFMEAKVAGKTYRMIRITGSRVVDPGDIGGGVQRFVTVYYGSPVKKAWNAIYSAVEFYALSSLIVLAITGILMTWLLKRGLAPLLGLAAGASRVSASSWTFEPPEEARKTKELAPLVHAIETVLGGLERSFAQQKRFVGDAAHELKTAVAVVKSSLQLLGMKQRTAQEYELGLERCLEDCARMEGIVAQMLTLARLEEVTIDTDESPLTRVSQCLQDAVKSLKTVAAANNIGMQLECQESLTVKMDPSQLELLSTNILLNALQHGRVDTTVRVAGRAVGDFVELRFTDRGEGIHPDDIPRIFERFSRVDPSRTRRTGGTGLGLAICKAITEKYKGNIMISSEPGSGTCVIVRFPLAR